MIPPKANMIPSVAQELKVQGKFYSVAAQIATVAHQNSDELGGKQKQIMAIADASKQKTFEEALWVTAAGKPNPTFLPTAIDTEPDIDRIMRNIWINNLDLTDVANSPRAVLTACGFTGGVDEDANRLAFVVYYNDEFKPVAELEKKMLEILLSGQDPSDVDVSTAPVMLACGFTDPTEATNRTAFVTAYQDFVQLNNTRAEVMGNLWANSLDPNATVNVSDAKIQSCGFDTDDDNYNRQLFVNYYNTNFVPHAITLAQPILSNTAFDFAIALQIQARKTPINPVRPDVDNARAEHMSKFLVKRLNPTDANVSTRAVLTACGFNAGVSEVADRTTFVTFYNTNFVPHAVRTLYPEVLKNSCGFHTALQIAATKNPAGTERVRVSANRDTKIALHMSKIWADARDLNNAVQVPDAVIIACEFTAGVGVADRAAFVTYYNDAFMKANNARAYYMSKILVDGLDINDVSKITVEVLTQCGFSVGTAAENRAAFVEYYNMFAPHAEDILLPTVCSTSKFDFETALHIAAVHNPAKPTPTITNPALVTFQNNARAKHMSALFVRSLNPEGLGIGHFSYFENMPDKGEQAIKDCGFIDIATGKADRKAFMEYFTKIFMRHAVGNLLPALAPYKQNILMSKGEKEAFKLVLQDLEGSGTKTKDQLKKALEVRLQEIAGSPKNTTAVIVKAKKAIVPVIAPVDLGPTAKAIEAVLSSDENLEAAVNYMNLFASSAEDVGEQLLDFINGDGSANTSVPDFNPTVIYNPHGDDLGVVVDGVQNIRVSKPLDELLADPTSKELGEAIENISANPARQQEKSTVLASEETVVRQKIWDNRTQVLNEFLKLLPGKIKKDFGED